MLLQNRTLWGAFVSLEAKRLDLPTLLKHASDLSTKTEIADSRNVKAFSCLLQTPVKYTRAKDLLNTCQASAEGQKYEFLFLSAAFTVFERRYYCFFVPFRNMLGAVLRRINSTLRGTGCKWHRVDLMSAVNSLPAKPLIEGKELPPSCTLCGLDLHLLGHGEQEMIFVGVNPAQSRVFAAITKESENFTLSPISATFCVTSGTRRKSLSSYFTIDRNGVCNVTVHTADTFLLHAVELVKALTGVNNFEGSIDRPVYRSRNAHKRAILASINAA